uniref:Monodehydroascorbate reductase n=1 Tax=Tanacetum cinerariifolium TaxID=118510 RepID=A0A6L2KNV5_TANCI|nr:hypothetical protein [Tanacetum cinerariifolium]
MDTTINQQAGMDEALVPHAQRLRIGRSNFRLLSDIKSKESTLQLVYDVLCICPFFKAFLVIADVPEIYMDMLHICPRVHGQSFDEPLFEEEILAFIRFLRHNAAIRMLTDVNINKLYQPWRSFAAIINKCLTRKSSGYDSLRLSQAQIMWGLYHKRNVTYAYLMWEDFVYQVEHKNSKKSNEMYYPRFTKVIIHHFMSKDPSIPRRNKFGALLPIELTNKEIKNSYAYKEYYAIAIGAAPPKPKASVRRTRSSSDTSITPPTAALSLRLTDYAKGKQTAKVYKAKSLSALSEVAMTEAQQLKLVTKRSMQQTHISHASGSGADEGTGADNEGKDSDDDEEDEGDDGEEGDGDDDDEDDDGEEGNDDDDDQEVERDDDNDDEEECGDDDQEYDEETKDEESFDPILKTLENSDDEGNGDEDLGLNVGGEEGHVEEEGEDELYKDVNINQGRGIQATLEVEDSHVILTLVNPDEDHQGAGQRTSQGTRLQDFTEQAVNEQLEAKVLTLSSHSSKTSYVVAVDLSEIELKKILIEKMEGNKSIQRSNKQRNLYKALVESYEFDKIILDTYGETVTLKRRRDVDVDKDEEPSAGPDRGSKRCREGKEHKSASAPTKTATKSAGRSTQGSRSRQASASESAFAEEPMQTTCQMEEPSHPEFDTGAEDQPIVQSSQHPEWFSQQQKPQSLDRDWNKTVSAIHGSIQPWISELTKQTDSQLLVGPTYELMKGSCKSLVELEYHLEEVFKATTDQMDWVNPEGQQYPYNLLKPLPLIPNNQGRRVIPFEHFINNDLEYLRGAYPLGSLPLGGKRQQFYGFTVNQESARDVYSKRRIIAVTELKIVEWHNYKHLDWITVQSNDDKLYKFKEGDFKRLCIQDIEDMCDGTLTDVRTALDDCLKGIQMQYLPQSIWRKSDKDRAAAMIQAINKRLKTRRIIRSLERFVGGRLYEGDFRMLQRTI